MPHANGQYAEASEPGLLCWSALKAHVVAGQYIHNHMQNDPAITAVLVQQLVLDLNLHSVCTSVKAVELKVAKLTTNLLGYSLWPIYCC